MTDDVEIRRATRADVPAIRALLADDDLGKAREDLSEEGLERYLAAFDAIAASPDNELYVAERDGRIVGTYQLTFIPYLSRGGNLRALIEAVRVAHGERGRGIGSKLMHHAIDRAGERGCLLAQLTSDKTREGAHRFYERHGFTASHEGYKRPL